MSELTRLVILVGLPYQKDPKTFQISVDVPFVKKVVRDYGNDIRREVSRNFSTEYRAYFGLPGEISGFVPGDFFWAAFLDPADVETLQFCSENFYNSTFWRNHE